MAFDKYIDNAWNQHAENAAMIAEGFKQGIALLTEPSQVTQLANLVTHVYGEHLGQFDRGLDFINQLMTHSLAAAKEQKELLVYRAILQVSADNKISLEQFSISEQVRILATSASISAGLGKITGAAELFEKAIQSSANLQESDSANKSMAVGSNNLAASLEQKPDLSEAEINLMLLAAQQSRKFWAIAGSWLQAERAEYRLAECYLKAGDILNSIKHANLCLTICEKNKAPALEMFYAYKAIASVEKAMKQSQRSLPQMEKFFELLAEDDKIWCKKDLDKIKI